MSNLAIKPVPEGYKHPQYPNMNLTGYFILTVDGIDSWIDKSEEFLKRMKSAVEVNDGRTNEH